MAQGVGYFGHRVGPGDDRPADVEQLPRLRGADALSPGLYPKTLALVLVAALIAVGGSGPSPGAHADAAISARPC